MLRLVVLVLVLVLPPTPSSSSAFVSPPSLSSTIMTKIMTSRPRAAASRAPFQGGGPRSPSPTASSDDDYDYDYDDYDDVRSPSSSSSSSSLSSDESASRALGERLIMAAAAGCGVDGGTVGVEWRGDRVVVTVDVNHDGDYDDDDDDDEEEEDVDEADYCHDDDGEEGLPLLDENLDDAGGEGSDVDDDGDVDGRGGGNDDDAGTDLTYRVARAINDALVLDAPYGPGYAIASKYDVVVTTPNFDGVLRGGRMFDSYRGFDVIVEHWEEEKKTTKKNKKKEKEKDMTKKKGEEGEGEGEGEGEWKRLKTTEGKLVGRDRGSDGKGGGGVTTINVRGRVVRIRNDDIVVVRLPKAKRERGVR